MVFFALQLTLIMIFLISQFFKIYIGCDLFTKIIEPNFQMSLPDYNLEIFGSSLGRIFLYYIG